MLREVIDETTGLRRRLVQVDLLAGKIHALWEVEVPGGLWSSRSAWVSPAKAAELLGLPNLETAVDDVRDDTLGAVGA